MRKLSLFGIVFLILCSFAYGGLSTDLIRVYSGDGASWDTEIIDEYGDQRYNLSTHSGDPNINSSCGISGDCLLCDGDDSINLVGTNMPTGNWSISFWLRADSLPGDSYFLASYSPEYYIHPQSTNSNVRFDWNNNFGYGNITIDTWSHYVLITNDFGMYIYKDGLLEEIKSPYASDMAWQDPIAMCDDRLFTGGSFYTGEFDEFYIYNRSLTTSEITNLASKTDVGFYPFPSNFSITASAINGTAIQSFSAYYTNNDTLISSTTDGTLKTILNGSVENITLTSLEDGGYFNKSYNNQNTSNDLSATDLFQVQADFIATNILSGIDIPSANFSYSTQRGTTLYFNAGTYDVTFFNSTTEHYNKTQEFTYSALDNVTSNLTGVYNSLLNVSAFLVTNNTNIDIFDINVTSVLPLYNLQYQTTSGDILAELEQNYNLSILLNYKDYSLGVYNITPQNNSDNYQFNVYTTNSFNFTFLDETNNQTITNPITVEFISDLQSYNYSTSTGFLYVDLLTPATYTIRYYSDNYGKIREFFYTLTNQSHQDITLYMINDGNSTTITVNVYDQLTVEPVRGTIVYLQRYFSGDNTYQTIGMYTTDVSGTSYFDIESDNEYYKILVDYPWLTRKYTSEEFYISATTYNIYISLVEEIGETFFNEQGIVSYITYNSGTDSFTATWTDSSAVATQYCLYIKKYGQYSLEVLNSSCSVSTTGSIELGGLANNVTNYAVLTAFIGGEERTLLSAWKDKISDELAFGAMGAFMSMIIVGVFALLISFHSIALILGAGGLVFSKLLGLLPMDWGYIFGVMFLAIILNLIMNLWKK